MAELPPNVHVSPHPLVEHKLNKMRAKECPPNLFRQHLREVTLLLTYEVMRELPPTLRWESKPLNTPISEMPNARTLGGRRAVIVPVIRAGLLMAEAIQLLLPGALSGHIGLHRSKKDFLVTEYLVNLPDVNDRLFILADPLIATGNTMLSALSILVSSGVYTSDIRVISLLSSYRGISRVSKKFPDVSFYTGFVDGIGEKNEGLNKEKYISPGLGDAGDRLFGTMDVVPDDVE